MNIKTLFLVLLCPILLFSQSNKKYQGLLWKISGNGLEEPSYLYGTMHVSNRVAFHLSEAFFTALENVDVIALEGNPENWMREIHTSTLVKDLTDYGAGQYGSNADLYSAFIPKEPNQNELAYYLSHDEDILNNFLYRTNRFEQDFEEQTYLDLYIFQAGKKSGKKIVALEDFDDSMKSVMKSGKYDEDAVRISSRQVENVLGDYKTWSDFQEDAYRKGDLDNLDTITSLLNPGKYYRKNMLDIRNQIMADGIDSLLKENRVFTGVGAAHLPGSAGVIELLRNMGYTVEPEEKKVTPKSMRQKEAIDDIIYAYKNTSFTSDDGLIQTIFPQQPNKITNSPYQEYIFADMANNAFYSIKRISTTASIFSHNSKTYMKKVDSLLFENIPGKILNQDTIQISGYEALDILNKTKIGDFQRYYIIYTPLEIIICKVGGKKDFVKTTQPQEFFKKIKLNSASFNEGDFSPKFGAFKIWLPSGYRSQNYRIALEKEGYTYKVESIDKNNQYFSAQHNQYQDYDYIEEDGFELNYFLEKIIDDEKLTLDTSYLDETAKHATMRFVLSNKNEGKVFGEIHIKGSHYIFLTTTAKDAATRQKYFNSFAFQPMVYQEPYKLKTDSTFNIQVVTNVRVNNNDEFFADMTKRNYGGDDKDMSFEGEYFSKYIYANTGEKIKLEFTTLGTYDSYETIEDYREYIHKYYGKSFIKYSDSIINSVSDTNYYKEIREIWYTDTNSTRAIRIKMILENRAIYYLTANVDTMSISSAFVDSAFASFSLTGDTLIGESILIPKNDLFFTSLASEDSVAVFEAVSSTYYIAFDADDIPKLQDVF